MPRCPDCQTWKKRRGSCAACDMSALAQRQVRYADQLREIANSVQREPQVREQYGPALEAGIASLRNDARNMRHVADRIREAQERQHTTAVETTP